MKKMLLLAMAVLLVGLFLGSVALAQDTTIIVDATAAPTTGLTAVTVVDLAPSGGPSLLLPAAALLLGTGVLTYTILRRGG